VLALGGWASLMRRGTAGCTFVRKDIVGFRAPCPPLAHLFGALPASALPSISF
jgi:hypothetical protein